MDNDFLFVTAASPGRIEAAVMHAVVACVKAMPGQVRVERIEHRTLYPAAAVRAAISRSRIVVVHSPLVAMLPIIILSRLVGAHVLAFVWDTYPVVIGGKRFDRRIIRRIADVAENTALSLCHRIYVPSFDFLMSSRLARATVLQLWPRLSEAAGAHMDSYTPGGVLRIIFAGQINGTRGLRNALTQLCKKVVGEFTLMIASNCKLPDDIAAHPNVVCLGFCSQNELIEHYATADFGLVSLATDFEGPAFPSKTLDYVAHGLPVIYVGPPLHFYLNTLTCSGVGVELNSVEQIDSNLATRLHADFGIKRDRFVKLACIKSEEIEREFSLSNVINDPSTGPGRMYRWSKRLVSGGGAAKAMTGVRFSGDPRKGC